MSSERFEFTGSILAIATTALCTVVAALYSVREGMRAKVRSEDLQAHPAPRGDGWSRRLMNRMRSWTKAGLTIFAAVVLMLSLICQSVSLFRTKVTRWNEATGFGETVRTTEWQTWRLQIHEKLSVEPVTEKVLIEALRIKIPILADSHTEAELLRRDEAVADVLLSYKGVKAILADRFGIRENFLGAGLSKPFGSTPYSSASVHEYFVENHSDTHDHVWLWRITPLGRSFSQPLQTLIAGDKERVSPENHQKKAHNFDDELHELLLRVKNKDHPFPPMIRFARFDQKHYRNTLGRPNAYRVFTSNLSEVWDLTIQQAAEKSGYEYKDGGDTLFIWVFVPYHSNEFAPATWRQVLEHLPDWLESKNHSPSGLQRL